MTGAGIAFHDLPAELVGDGTALTVLALPGAMRVMLVAGRGAAGEMTISAVTDSWIETLWPLVPAKAGAVSGHDRVDLVATGQGRAMALIRGEALIALDPLAEDEGLRALRLRSGRTGPPDRICALEGALTGLWLRSDGRTLLAVVDTTGKRVAGSDRAGPTLRPGQAVVLIVRDVAGRDVVVAEDHRTGFHLWRQEGLGDWAHLTGDGAARHAMNAGVVAGVLWGDRIVLATGSTMAVRQALPRMAVAGELIALDPDGVLRLLAGELRVSGRGLMVPELSAAGIMALGLGQGLGQVADLAVDAGGRLVIAVSRRDGTGAIAAIAPDLSTTPLGAACPPVLGFVRDDTAPGAIAATLAG